MYSHPDRYLYYPLKLIGDTHAHTFFWNLIFQTGSQLLLLSCKSPAFLQANVAVAHISYFIKNSEIFLVLLIAAKRPTNLTTETLKRLPCRWQSKGLSLLCSQHSLCSNHSWLFRFYILSPTHFLDFFSGRSHYPAASFTNILLGSSLLWPPPWQLFHSSSWAGKPFCSPVPSHMIKDLACQAEKPMKYIKKSIICPHKFILLVFPEISKSYQDFTPSLWHFLKI